MTNETQDAELVVQASNISMAAVNSLLQQPEVKREEEKPVVDDAVEKATKKGINPYKSRFHDAIWFDRLSKEFVSVLGCGGIGSFVIFGLSRIGCPMVIYDMDMIETHNLGGQLFGTVDIGAYKTAAIADQCLKLSGHSQIYTFGEFTERDGCTDVMIAAFDNMKARKLAFKKWKQHVEDKKSRKEFCIFIDGRLMAEDYQVYAVTYDRCDEYEKTLFDDSEIEELPCTLKSTTHCSMGIASDIISVLTNFMTNLSLGENIREVPFRICKSIQAYTYELTLNV